MSSSDKLTLSFIPQSYLSITLVAISKTVGAVAGAVGVPADEATAEALAGDAVRSQ